VADTLAVTLTAQASDRNLDSSEKLGAAGPYAVRAYPSGEANADEGAIVSIEWRHRLSEQLQVSAFYDFARIRRDHRLHIGSAPSNTVNLSGVGLGVTWGDPKVVAITASVAARTGSNPLPDPVTGADPSGSNSHVRGWLTVVRSF
jgi:hemolysin activation/secretion protein